MKPPKSPVFAFCLVLLGFGIAIFSILSQSNIHSAISNRNQHLPTLPAPAPKCVSHSPQPEQVTPRIGAPFVKDAPHTSEISIALRLLRQWQIEGDPLKRAALESRLKALLNINNAAEMVKSLPEDLLNTPFGETALRLWASLAHKDAAAWLSTHADATGQQKGAVIYGWIERNQDEFNQYIDTLPPGQWKQSILTFATNDALVGKKPTEAITCLTNMKATPQRDEMLGWAVTAWARTDFNLATQWANQVNDFELREKMLASAATGYAGNEPAQAALGLAQFVPPGPAFDSAKQSIAALWAQRDTPAAANWVKQFPEGAARANTLNHIIAMWNSNDPQAVQGWVEALPPSTLRTDAENALARAKSAALGKAD